MSFCLKRSALLALLFVAALGFQKAEAFCPASAPCMGINRFELGSQFIRSNWGHVGEPEFDQIALKMSLKSIDDATWDGIRFVRFAAGDYGPNTYEGPGILREWKDQSTREEFFQKYDRLFDEADRRGLKLVPSLIWNPPQIPALAGLENGSGETVVDMMRNPHSRSYQLAEQWVRSFVARYKNRESVLFWEIGNEWNLSVDLKTVQRCWADWGQGHEICQPKGNYTTSDLIQFAERLRRAIKEEDQTRKISTGYGYPAPYAQNLRQAPEWTSKPNFSDDSQKQVEQYLSDINSNFEIVSVHHYPISRLMKLRDRSLLQYVRDWAQRRGQELFVGEYGSPNGFAGTSNFTSSSYLLQTLRDILALNIRWSAAWVYQFYQTDPSVPNEFNVEQGMTDVFLQGMRQHTFVMEPHLRPTGSQPPSLLVTAPAKEETVDQAFTIHALSSDDSGAVESVKFLKSTGELITQVVRPPFLATVVPSDFSFGKNTITVEACDYEQNCTKELVSFIRPGSVVPIGPGPVTPVTCELSVSPELPVYFLGQEVEFSVSSNPAGFSYRLIGRPKKLPQIADQSVTPARVQITLAQGPGEKNPPSKVTRRAEILDQNGKVVCRTKAVRLVVSGERDFTPQEAAREMDRDHKGTRQ
ncbi:MAG: cellulase family glycosylhydrolase [Bdellovibrionales bacterium]|nr:cellulase family glycosylhydrolase [Bdellovibrionales bacterium]